MELWPWSGLLGPPRLPRSRSALTFLTPPALPEGASQTQTVSVTRTAQRVSSPGQGSIPYAYSRGTDARLMLTGPVRVRAGASVVVQSSTHTLNSASHPPHADGPHVGSTCKARYRRLRGALEESY